MTQRPALEQLMGAYIHQDWSEDGTIWDAVDLFVNQDPTAAGQLPKEIDDCLLALPTEPELKHYVIDQLGGYYLADAHGGTYREWLTQIADRVRAATA